MTAAIAPIRLLVSDIDGTLVTPDKQLTPAAVAAAAALKAAGVIFTIVSSRPPRGMAALIQALGIDAPVAGFNGGAIAAPDLRVLERLTVPTDAARAALQLFDQQGIGAWVFARDQWWLRDPDGPKVGLERRTVGFDPSVTPDFEAVIGEIDKIVGVSEDHGLLGRVEVQAQQRLEGRAAAVRSQPYYLDVTHRDANKGHAVRALCRRLGVDPANLAVIGDMGNDVSMFVEAGLAIAMGQADEAVRRKADAVTAANTEDGFAKAARTLVLPRAPGPAP